MILPSNLRGQKLNKPSRESIEAQILDDICIASGLSLFQQYHQRRDSYNLLYKYTLSYITHHGEKYNHKICNKIIASVLLTHFQ